MQLARESGASPCLSADPPGVVLELREVSRVKITPNQVFLHGADRYEEGTEYDVSDADGTYFVNAGWADSDEFERETGLDVHDSQSGQS
jgi:hypothetical protein